MRDPRRRVRARLVREVERVLAPRRGLLPPLEASLRGLANQVAALDGRLAATAVLLERQEATLAQVGAAVRAGRPLAPPALGPDTTIEAAWHSHPRAPAVFARYHLPACDGCSVRFDETLAEAAGAYGIDLAAFLAALRAP